MMLQTDPPTERSAPLPVRLAVVANPTKLDPGSKESVLEALANAGLPAPQWLETTEEDPGRGMVARAVSSGADLLLVLGGDGTVRACAAGLAGTEVPMALLPAGTGNLLARNLGIPDSLEEAVQLVVAGRRRRIDLVELDGEPFAVMGGCGFDALMFQNTPEAVKARVGWAAYVMAGVRSIRDAKPRPVDIVVDGRASHHRAVGVVVANVGELTGGVQLLPNAAADDGRVDVAVLTPPRLRDWVGLGTRLLIRRSPKARQMHTDTGTAVTVRWQQPMATEADGDVMEPRSIAEFRVRAASVTVCVPA